MCQSCRREEKFLLAIESRGGVAVEQAAFYSKISSQPLVSLGYGHPEGQYFSPCLLCARFARVTN
jgi:hypothetical protein